MAKSFLKLDTRRALKDGSYPIVIVVGYGRDVYLPTAVSCRREDWDPAALCCGRGGKQANAVLRSLLASVSAKVMELRERGIFDALDNKQLRALLKGADPEAVAAQSRQSLAALFEAYIGARCEGRTAQIYADTAKRLAQHCDASVLTFDDVSAAWLDAWASSMRGLSPNTRSMHLRNLRAVNNYALDIGAAKNYPFRRYRMPKQTSRHRALSAEVVRRLASLPCGRYAEYRDAFMLIFCLVGINIVDLCSLRGMAGGRIEYRRAKTHRPYSIRVEPEAAAIIERLRGKDWLLRFLDTHKDYRSYYRQLRRGLEAVRARYNEQYPAEPLAELTTYWARHSWATIARAEGVSVDDIALALGHGDGHDLTHIYIDEALPKIDEANRRVLDAVFK